MKLRQNPLCELCLKVGELEVATAVDHVVAIRAGGEVYPSSKDSPRSAIVATTAKHVPSSWAARPRPKSSPAATRMAVRAIRGVANDDFASFGPRAPLLSDTMISLNDTQLKTVMAAAARVPHEKRAQFLERISAMLTFRGRLTDGDVDDVVGLALVGMIHESAVDVRPPGVGQPTAPVALGQARR